MLDVYAEDLVNRMIPMSKLDSMMKSWLHSAPLLSAHCKFTAHSLMLSQAISFM